ncbi:MAG TPA: hypothetical protein VNG90_05425 [Candidatus Acidoferrum sp.]|nr:hypothetical protein [Candidatus Acidoferrum sp.]
MRFIDRLLGRVTMYRLLEYYLFGLVGVAMVLAAVGILPFSPIALACSTGFLLLLCIVTNKVFALVFEAPANPPSSWITALILALIITPPPSVQGYVFLSAAGGLAIASKYILAINKKHIFNPAAVALVLTALGAGDSASWWIGTTWMVPFVVVGGLLLVRKIERGRMAAVFIGAALLATAGLSLASGGNLPATLQTTLLHSPLFFMAFVMLTEPLTSPTSTAWQMGYAALAGVLLPPHIHVAGLYSTPELDLVVANLFAYLVSPKVKLFLRLSETVAWGPNIRDFIYALDKPLQFKPGQYMEFTLPHADADARGVRRYFTIASSPTENNLRIGVKFYQPGSSFKHAMLAMTSQTPFAAGQLGGDFVLPSDPTRKLAFIAGGIGITPFRSMIKHLLDTGSQQPVTLVYAERAVSNLAYTDVFAAAQQWPTMRIVYAITGANQPVPEGMRASKITASLIKHEIPDFSERLFYVSGSPAMIAQTRHILKTLGIHDRCIKVDLFSGYA